MRIGLVELELLYLGISNNGTFNEKNMKEANIEKFGVGRILDILGELREKKWIELDKNGSFLLTTSGRNVLWNKKMPLWLRILHLLEIKSFPEDIITRYLSEDANQIQTELEKIRKKELIMMTTLRKESRVEKMFELLQSGKEELEKIQQAGYENAQLGLESNRNTEITDLLEDIKKIISEEIVNEEKKNQVIKKISEIKKRLGV